MLILSVLFLLGGNQEFFSSSVQTGHMQMLKNEKNQISKYTRKKTLE